MNDIYVLNQELETIGIVDTYKSLIWSDRYNQLGDCELYVAASDEMINILQMGNYLFSNNDDMVCRINKMEIDTSSEEGNYLIVNGTDVKSFLDQRIIWGIMNCNGNVEDFIRLMVTNTLATPQMSYRKLVTPTSRQLLYLGDKSNFTEITTEQVSYKNVGEKVREYCTQYGWGYKIILNNNAFYFYLYKGTNRSNTVVFSDNYENLSSTKYTEDDTNLGNVALIGGQGEGSSRSTRYSGNGKSVDRYEIFVDAKDLSSNINYSELTATYPGGTIVSVGSAYGYQMSTINIQIVDDNQLTELQTNYPGGTEITIDGNEYYQITNVIIADLDTNEPTDNTSVNLRSLIYGLYLYNRGYEKLSEYGNTTTFEGSVEPNTTFVYGKDYFLGDIVTVQNEYGITASARITEIIKVYDDNGYSIEPKFEYIEII